jgi:hypothetical protein
MLPRISAKTLSKIAADGYCCKFMRVAVIDAQFRYEYDAGHIIGSLNLLLTTQLVDIYEHHQVIGDNTYIIFYCEFSVDRGPTRVVMFGNWIVAGASPLTILTTFASQTSSYSIEVILPSSTSSQN